MQSKLADFADKVRQFEERKADWEREMASREQRLKGEMQMLSMKHQELQAREAALGGGSTSPQPVARYAVQCRGAEQSFLCVEFVTRPQILQRSGMTDVAMQPSTPPLACPADAVTVLTCDTCY